MRPASLRHRVTFQTQTADLDDHGQAKDTWTNLATVWASIEDVSSRELIRGGVTTAQITTRIRIRHRDDITAGMRAVSAGRTFEITGPPIDAEGRGRELEIPCREITP